jgi:hypothetical protein
MNIFTVKETSDETQGQYVVCKILFGISVCLQLVICFKVSLPVKLFLLVPGTVVYLQVATSTGISLVG